MARLLPLTQIYIESNHGPLRPASPSHNDPLKEAAIYLNEGIIKMVCPMAPHVSQVWLVGQSEPIYVKESAADIAALCESAILVKLVEPPS